jgi:anti-sigma-K factor RskA
MKPCPDRKESLALLAAGVLESSAARDIQIHLENCPDCRAYLAGMQQLCSDLASTRPAETALQPSPGFHARLKHRVQAEKTHRAPSRFIEFILACLDHRRLIGATAAAVAVVLVVWISLGPGDRLTPELSRKTNPEPSAITVERRFDPAGSSTLMAYQAAFNQSFEDFDALISLNAERSSTGDGMRLMGGPVGAF